MQYEQIRDDALAAHLLRFDGRLREIGGRLGIDL